eukprot:CAMPEP_0204647190 /NCGR_PEP_ID=MMETSP0718-20130828/5714_1 /ASSEMBLY_ACC=CAM_ASM_000674 /TAXON_ID=230516 /ORGANISM="Chaetoceros curvisetus" /LENGTH=65 /DNA_ID=CAMNT_0051669681 /DNA_START=1 /DNA_END=198 /DNA_ORIENTATION=+
MIMDCPLHLEIVVTYSTSIASSVGYGQGVYVHFVTKSGTSQRLNESLVMDNLEFRLRGEKFDWMG